MTRVTIDEEIRKVLLNFTKPLELCDETGSILGKLIPTKPDVAADDWIDLTPDETDEEIDRAIDSGEETYSTHDLIDQIKKMRGL
ncbi:MAG TPA: hypothetical protein VJ828_13670 [Lacipirellulaceae bacterium]|nr:hypothetical protein [Lacipirellulaceae bacterium]